MRKAKAKRRPRHYRYRSAVTGRAVTEREAKSSPSTTYKVSTKKKKK